MNDQDLLYRLKFLLDDVVADNIPYFTAQEVSQLLKYYGIELPVTYSVWEWDSEFTVAPSEGSEATLRSVSGEHPVLYKNKEVFHTLSAANAISVVYEVAHKILWQGFTIEEAEELFGSALRPDGTMEWWAKAFLLVGNKPELTKKHFPRLG